MKTVYQDQEMKQFNRVIKIEIDANTIVQKLLSEINPEFKHSVLLAETIIGSADDRALGMIYNSLNGFTNEINFETGDLISINDYKSYSYISKSSEESLSQEYISITEGEVIDVDIYKEEKLKIAYYTVDRNGEQKRNETWISHYKCNRIQKAAQY